MSKIDWSKAPEGATHAGVDSFNCRTCWYKDVTEAGYNFLYTVGSLSRGWKYSRGNPVHQPLERRPEEKRGIVCECCQGEGTIDETLGGEAFSNPEAECPDCDGAGEIEIGETSATEPQWVPGETLPPVGIECEAFFMHGASTKWRRAEILKHVVRECAVYVPEVNALGWCNTFRPIKSHRDKVIEAAMKRFKGLALVSPKNAIEKLEDMLKLPEGE